MPIEDTQVSRRRTPWPKPCQRPLDPAVPTPDDCLQAGLAEVNLNWRALTTGSSGGGHLLPWAPAPVSGRSVSSFVEPSCSKTRGRQEGMAGITPSHRTPPTAICGGRMWGGLGGEGGPPAPNDLSGENAIFPLHPQKKRIHIRTPLSSSDKTRLAELGEPSPIGEPPGEEQQGQDVCQEEEGGQVLRTQTLPSCQPQSEYDQDGGRQPEGN